MDKQIISLISKDLPLVSEPFKKMASGLKIREEALIERIRLYKKTGLMRKLAAVVNHRKVGFKYNAMVVWNIPDKFVEKYGKIMASFSQVSHCYQRKETPNWNYNLYSMIHAKTKKECLNTVKKISEKIGLYDFQILFSSKEYKKTGVNYSVGDGHAHPSKNV